MPCPTIAQEGLIFCREHAFLYGSWTDHAPLFETAFKIKGDNWIYPYISILVFPGYALYTVAVISGPEHVFIPVYCKVGRAKYDHGYTRVFTIFWFGGAGLYTLILFIPRFVLVLVDFPEILLTDLY